MITIPTICGKTSPIAHDVVVGALSIIGGHQ